MFYYCTYIFEPQKYLLQCAITECLEIMLDEKMK